MNNKLIRLVALFLLLCVQRYSAASQVAINPAQDDYEKSIGSVVRNKLFYKTGHIEITPTAGAMPYDSLINYFTVGGRATWHIADHFGWEIADAEYAFPNVTGYTTGLVSAQNVSNLQTVQMQWMVSTNFLVSPIYGKIRLLGAQVLFFDIYLVGGFGAASTQTLKVSNDTGSVVTSTVRSGVDPMADLGLGFRFFLNNAIGLVIDLRDYMTYSQVYGNMAIRSNFATSVGLSFFLPIFG